MRDRLRELPTLVGTAPSFDPVQDAVDDPIELFLRWFRVAIDSGLPEPHAMTIATADERGCPSSRVLICKNVDARGWHFATSADSRIGRELGVNPYASLVFYWKELARQVRVVGTVEAATAEENANDFRARPLRARAEALVGRKGEPLSDRAEVEPAVAEARDRLEREPDLVAPSWTVYILRPTEVEFWQADPDRRHLRLRYRRAGLGWEREQLWP